MNAEEAVKQTKWRVVFEMTAVCFGEPIWKTKDLWVASRIIRSIGVTHHETQSRCRSDQEKG